MADCKRKTANLFDVSTVYSDYYQGDGTVRGITSYVCQAKNYFTADQIGKSITISVNAKLITATRMYINTNVNNVTKNSNSINSGSTGQMTVTVTPTSTSDYWKISYGSDATDYCELDQFMVNEGSTALPYEPYGWVHSLRKLTTATDTFTTLPVDIYADGNNATVGLKGNTVQSGTPTPDNPVDVNGVGVRTENLFDGSTSATNQRLSTSGTGTYGAKGYSVSSFIEIEPSTYYTITTGETTYYNLYNENKQYIYGAATNARISDSYANARYIRFDFKTENIPSVMLVKGSTTPSAYEPYGYKIPISSGQQTTNIYLGSTQTVRKIGKIDLSKLSWTLITTGLWKTNSIPNIKYVSTNYSLGYGIAEKYTIHIGAGMSTALNCIAIDVSQVSVNNGSASETPTGMFWYALATPETAAVNEPLMKIGNYADTLSNATSIPTIEGANSITVDTTVQPSEFTATWTGWHDASVKEKSENLVDESKVTPNTYIGGSGETGGSTSSNLTDYIDINASPFVISGVITGSLKSANNRALCFYDSDKNFISSVVYSPNVMTSPALISDIPQNAKYVRFAFDKAFENGIMLNTGSTALPYEPYWK